MEHLEYYLLIGVFVPLAMFIVLAFFGAKIGKPGASAWAILGILTSFGCSSYVLYQWRFVMDAAERHEASTHAFSALWATLGDIDIYAAVKLDSLTIAMFFMVTLIASCIFIFSRGYMAGHSDEVDGVSKYHRFFAYLSLFAFSMLGLVVSENLIFLFIFWELVGVCSYLLIGFYFDKKFASDAAMKAFITNRVGDFGFIIGLALVGLYLGDFSIDGAAAAFAEQAKNHTGIFADSMNIFGWTISGGAIATMMGLALFCGCLGKSAQVPLQVWLPDAMAGPTPVSALIHAATMVAAGVYLVARVYALLTPDAQMIIAFIGCVTLTMAALIAIVQTDIKKVLAYSTLSQLGYMVFGLGVGAWVGALFHLITHAFFKAMMFLGSGQVIEGCHHEQDIRKMGGLIRKMPVTAVTFLVGVLAIAGVGLPEGWVHKQLGLGGYYSKEEILAVGYYRAYGLEAGHGEHHDGHDDGHVSNAHLAAHAAPSHGGTEHGDHAHGTSFAHLLGGERLSTIPKWMIWLAIITAYITPFYMMRVWWLTFMGKPRDEHVHGHAHESPMMYMPLVVLCIGTFASSWFLFRPMISEASTDAMPSAAGSATLIAPLHSHEDTVHHFAAPALTNLAWPGFIVGFIVAFAIYRNGLGLAHGIRKLPGVGLIHHVLMHKFYFDEVYNLFLVMGTRAFAVLNSLFDKFFIDGTLVENAARLVKFLASFSGSVLDAKGVDGAVNGVGYATFRVGDAFRSIQTGLIRNYVLFTSVAVIIVLLAMIILF